MNLYVIEARKPDGSLDFTNPQPEQIFGNAAIHGIEQDRMAKIVFRHAPNAVLTGDAVSQWPRFVDSRFSARVKTWR